VKRVDGDLRKVVIKGRWVIILLLNKFMIKVNIFTMKIQSFVLNWMFATDRDSWRKILREAEALTVL
jgi:hypothetical protein